MYDSCGRAGGGPKPTGGKGEYVTTKFAKLGDMGSKLPRLDSGVTWKVGSVVETLWSVRANREREPKCARAAAVLCRPPLARDTCCVREMPR